MKKKLISLLILLTVYMSSQERAISTGAPFLSISPDARSGGLGDQGVATPADAFSQFWNPSKYIFSDLYTSGIGVSYTPYMNKLTNDVFLLYGTYYTFLNQEKTSTLAANIYYFNMGEIELNKLDANRIITQGKSKPNEFSFGLSYGLKISDIFSMSVGAKFIYSDLFNNISDNTNANTQAATSVAVDISGYLQTIKDTYIGDKEGRWRAGWAINNLGPRLDYSSQKDQSSYLPTNLKLGGGYDLFLDNDNRLGLTLEATKLLVPGSRKKIDENGAVIYQMPDYNFLSGVFHSFGNVDAFKEVTYSISGEYEFDRTFAFRTGYFYENPNKGSRQYVTLGAGLNYQSFGIDFSYLITTSSINDALDNTLRFSLLWNFGTSPSNSNLDDIEG